MLISVRPSQQDQQLKCCNKWACTLYSLCLFTRVQPFRNVDSSTVLSVGQVEGAPMSRWEGRLQKTQGDVNAAQLEFTTGVTNRVQKMDILATQTKQLLKKSGSQQDIRGSFLLMHCNGFQERGERRKVARRLLRELPRLLFSRGKLKVSFVGVGRKGRMRR